MSRRSDRRQGRQNRREFLAGLGAGAAGTAWAGAAAGAEVTARASAAQQQQIANASIDSVITPIEPPGGVIISPFCKKYKILRIHIYAAMSHRETLWWDDASKGWATWRQLPNMSSVQPGASSSPLLFANTGSYNVYLGPGARPALGSDLYDHSRLVVLEHDQPQHTIGSALSLTGVRQGRPGFAGLGARIRSRNLSSPLPASWVLNAGAPSSIVSFAAATGELIPSARPFVLPIGSDAVKSNLNRASVEHQDALTSYYTAAYADRMTHATGRVRSTGFEVYENSHQQLVNWQDVYQLIQDGPSVQPVQSGYADTQVTRGIEFGAYLLNEGVRHVDVVGYGTGPGTIAGNVDTHGLDPYSTHCTHQNGVLFGVFNTLRNLVDQGKLDLAHTMVVVQSEFGRANFDNDGTEHWGTYSAYLACKLFSQRGLAGSIDFASNNKGKASGGYDPTSLNAALATAAGVEPFDYDMWDLATFPIQPDPGASNPEASAKQNLLSGVFGVSSLCQWPIIQLAP